MSKFWEATIWTLIGALVIAFWILCDMLGRGVL